MTRSPARFLALVTKGQLAEMMAPTYARARNIDPNEAYQRLELALRDLRLIDGLQQGIWRGLLARKPALDPVALIETVSGKLGKRRQYKPVPTSRANDGPLAALTILIDAGAGVSSGEALGLLESPDGEALLEKGFTIAGHHLAGELLRS